MSDIECDPFFSNEHYNITNIKKRVMYYNEYYLAKDENKVKKQKLTNDVTFGEILSSQNDCDKEVLQFI